jgi:chemotaxis protein CheZ
MSKTKKQDDSHEQSQVYDQEFTDLLKDKTDALKTSVDNGDYRNALDQIRDLDMMRDKSLYREVGRLTRSLHEAIQNFHIDAHNAEQQAELSKMADASDRLAYVVKMTSQAANRTLDLVEESMPLSGEIREQARQIGDEWAAERRNPGAGAPDRR